MTIKEWLEKSTEKLKESAISSARLDSLVLLEDKIEKNRSWILAHQEFKLKSEDIRDLNRLIERRRNHEPLAYIRGKSEFYGRLFKVSVDTLQPRSETETMIELLLSQDAMYKKRSTKTGINGPIILDLGTGSGCIAITAKLEIPESTVMATDINKNTLNIAKQNSQQLKATVEFRIGNLIQPFMNISEQITYILANLPYVPDSHTINEAAMKEPSLAIFGGPDGLKIYRDMFNQVSLLSDKPLNILTEALPFQHEALRLIAQTNKYELKETRDLIQHFTLNDAS